MSIPITVVIPTRNRGHTIGETLRTCLQQPDDFQILVCDNVSEDDTEEVVRKNSDSRVKYVRSPNLLSMERNWEYALTHLEGGYVTLIGSDDGLLPGAISSLREVIAETGARVIRPPLITYYWEGYPLPEFAGMALNFPVCQRKWWWVDSQTELKRCADNVLQHQLLFRRLPSLYGGCIDLTLLREVKAKHGNIIVSKMPDMYTATLCAALVEKYLFMGTPVTMNAMSGSSNAVAQFLRGHLTNADGRHFWEEVSFPYDTRLVEESADPNIVFSLPLLVADQFLKVKALGYPAPDIAFAQVMKATVIGATRWREREQYDGAIEVALTIARLHNLQPECEVLIRQHPYTPRYGERNATHFNSQEQSYDYLDMRPFGTQGVASASVDLARVHQMHVEQAKTCSQLPPLEPAELDFTTIGQEGLLTWLCVNVVGSYLQGSGVICTTQAERPLRHRFLKPPSLAQSIQFTQGLAGLCNQKDLNFILVPDVTDLLHADRVTKALSSLAIAGRLVLLHTADQRIELQEALQFEISLPIKLDAPEGVSLALARLWKRLPEGRKKSLLRLSLKPLASYLAARMGGETSRRQHSGWCVSVWSRTAG